MALVKIPLVIIYTLAFRKTMSPPNPPSPKSALRHQKAKAGQSIVWFLKYCMFMHIVAGISEVAVILAAHSPRSQMTKIVLSALIFPGGDPLNLRLTKTTLLGWIMIMVGVLIRWSTYRYLGSFFRFDISIQNNHRLVTGGPYSIVRHPSYTGLLLIYPGWFLWQFGDGSWINASGLWNTLLGRIVVLIFIAVVLCGSFLYTFPLMYKEDEVLHKQFGAEWEEWAEKVKYKVLPYVF